MNDDRGLVGQLYILEQFHSDCPDVELDYPILFCKTCRVIAHVDMVSTRLRASEAIHTRDAILEILASERRRA